jgi:hypothetical protein
MASISESDCQNKREFSRVNVHLPVEIRLVPPEQRRLICTRLEEKIFTGVKLPPDVADPLLAEWLKLLHDKLDRILGLLATNQGVRELPPFITETLSGGGMSFTSPEEYKLGDLLELRIIFDSSRSGTLYLYGEVVQKEKTEWGYFIAVKFLSLDEGIRDEIIKFVFEKEREILRQKRKE